MGYWVSSRDPYEYDEDAPRLDVFLLARFDEEEAVARAAQQGDTGRWVFDPSPSGYVTGQLISTDDSVGAVASSVLPADAEHMGRWDPTRVLVDLASKRAIVAEHKHKQRGLDGRGDNDEFECGGCSAHTGFYWCRNLVALAQPYQSHPEFRDDWRS